METQKCIANIFGSGNSETNQKSFATASENDFKEFQQHVFRRKEFHVEARANSAKSNIDSLLLHWSSDC
jgi:hypothetical protein